MRLVEWLARAGWPAAPATPPTPRDLALPIQDRYLDHMDLNRSSFVFAAHPVADGFRVELSGDVSLARAGAADVALGLLRPPARTLTLDLAGLEFCGSGGLPILLTIRNTAIEAGWTFQTVNVQPPVRRMFDLTGVTERLHVLERDPSGTH